MRPLGKKQEILLVLTCALLTLFAQTTLLYAQEGSEGSVPDWISVDRPVSSDESASENTNSYENPDNFKDFREDSLFAEEDWKEERRQIFLDNIKAEIRGSEKELFDVNANMKDTRGRLDDVHEEISTLGEQIANLDSKIATSKQLVLNVAAQIQEKENQILLLYSDIELKQAEIEHQKRMLSDYLQMLYKQETAISDSFSGNSEINIAKLLLSDEPVGDQLQKIKYFNILEQQGHDIFDRLELLVDDLEEDKELAKVAKDRLAKLYLRLDEERENLQLQRDAKQRLMDITRGEESIYQSLIDETRKQQEELQSDLRELRDNLFFIREEMRILGDKFDPSDYRDLFSGEKKSIYAYINAFRDDVEGFRLSWPVYPGRGISAYFRDSAYVGVFGVPHNAVDIPTAQKTTVRSPAEGVVYKVRDNGYGYSYLIIAHKGGFMTVYGHIYDFLVESGERVRPGQAVAISGGTPGTKGAGYMTTGAHLHFELMKGGSYMDPLYFLPLSLLNYDSLPKKYQVVADEQNVKVSRIAVDEEEEVVEEVVEEDAS